MSLLSVHAHQSAHVLYMSVQAAVTADVTLCKSSLFALTANNWLHRYELDSGKLLERIFLSPQFKFRSLFNFMFGSAHCG